MLTNPFTLDEPYFLRSRKVTIPSHWIGSDLFTSRYVLAYTGREQKGFAVSLEFIDLGEFTQPSCKAQTPDCKHFEDLVIRNHFGIRVPQLVKPLSHANIRTKTSFHEGRCINLHQQRWADKFVQPFGQRNMATITCLAKCFTESVRFTQSVKPLR